MRNLLPKLLFALLYLAALTPAAAQRKTAGSLTANSAMASDTAAWGAATGPLTWLKASGNRRYATSDNVQLLNPFSLATPSFQPRTGSPIVVVSPATAPVIAPNFTDAKVSDSFFTKVAHIGAFDGSTNQMAT